MKYIFIEDYRSTFRIEKMCHVLKVSRSGYYKWRNREKSTRELENEKLLEEIRKIYEEHKGRYGSPRITKEIKSKGIGCSKNRIARLMNKNTIRAKTKKRYRITTLSKHDKPIAPNLLEKSFNITRSNEIWASDITYVWTTEGWSYLSVILDLYSRKVIGWALEKRLTKDLVIKALDKALGERNLDKEIIFHSDRGSQYASNEFRRLLDMHHFRQSMSGKGNCYDNAVVESFFHTLKNEEVYFEKYDTREIACQKLFEYIEIYYNRKRRHSTLGYVSPVEFKYKEELENVC